MYTYILKCGGNTYYTGFAADIEKRLRRHLGLDNGGAKFTTRLRKPEYLAALWEDTSGKYARKLEYRIKKQLSHAQKERLCSDMKLSFRELGIDLPDDELIRLSTDELNKKYSLRQ